LLGGGVALGGAAALGKLGERTTIIRQEAIPSSSAPVAFAQGKRMSINEIYRASAPAVVHIDTTSRVQQPTDFFGNPFGGSQTQRALGSGFVIDKTGHIVTNYHVVQGAKTIQVSFSDNERFKATVVGVDPSTDTAVLQVHVKSRALKSLPLGNSDAVRVGDHVRRASTVRVAHSPVAGRVAVDLLPERGEHDVRLREEQREADLVDPLRCLRQGADHGL